MGTFSTPHDPFAPKPAKSQQFKRYRWLMSYADMITLLMAMFILMLSLSSTDSKKFDEQAAEMRKVFNQGSGGNLPVVSTSGISLDLPVPVLDEDVETAARQREWRTSTMGQVRDALAGEIAGNAAQVLETTREVIIRFPDTSAFASGSADLRESILPALDRVALILKRIDGQVVVSGHTDNIPISTARFRSNWDLAVSRSVSVVHYLLKDNRLAANRVTAQGFAESRPLAGNETAEGRGQNRRVDVAITMPDQLAQQTPQRRR